MNDNCHTTTKGIDKRDTFQIDKVVNPLGVMPTARRSCAVKAKRPICPPARTQCKPSRTRKAKKKKRNTLPPIVCGPVEKKSSSRAKPCVLNRIVDYLVSKTIRCRPSGSNSSNSARATRPRVHPRSSSSRQGFLSPRAKVEMEFIIRHLKLLARVEEMEERQ